MPQPPMIDTGYKPEFDLGAVYQGINAGTAENLQNQAVMHGALSNIVKQKEALHSMDEMNPEYRKSRIAGKIGENQTKKATGEYDTAILGDKIKSATEKLKAEGQTAQYSQIMTTMEKTRNALETLLPELEGQSPNLGMGIDIAQRAAEAGLPPQMAQQIANARTPEDIESLKKLKATLTYVLTQTPKHRQDMEKEELKSTTHIEQSRMAAEASRYGADSRAKSEEIRRGDDDRRFETSERNATVRALVSQITNLQTRLVETINKHNENFNEDFRNLRRSPEAKMRYENSEKASLENIKSLKTKLERLEAQADSLNSGVKGSQPTSAAPQLPPGVTLKSK